MTTCDGARRLLDAYQLDELAPADARELAQHVRTCPACASEMGGISQLVALLGSLPEQPAPSLDLDERILAAALTDRARRHEHRSWLGDLRRQIVRGALRTTGTLAATIVAVSLIGAAFVFAASQFVAQLPPFTSRATITPVVTPTPAPSPRVSVEASAPPSQASQAPAETTVPATREPAASPEPTKASTASPSTTAPTPTPEPSPAASGTPAPSPTAQPAESPSPSPTEKPRRTPPPSSSPTPSPTPTPAPTVAPTTSP